VSAAQKQASGHLSEVDWETGQSLSKWNNFVVGLAEKVNAVTSGINKVLKFFHLGQIEPWKPAGYGSTQSLKTENYKPDSAAHAKQYDLAKGYASGTNHHPGGHSLVGEEGPELAYIPYSGKYTLLGANGPEIANVPRGASILPAAQTKAVLNGGLGAGAILPGYAGGVGDFFKTAYNWAIHPVDSLKNLVSNYANFGSNDIGLSKGLGVGILEYYRDKAGPWLKDNLSPFAGLGSNGKGGSAQAAQWLTAAMTLTNTPLSYLGALMKVAMKESGGNPKAINLWDSNAKAGHPSKGLMQTIDSTFNKYKLPGLDDIWNPVANAVAAIRYMNARYGSISNVPGVKSAKYVGYKNGGRKFGNDPVLVGEDGPEILNPPDGSQIHNTNKTQALLKSKGNIQIQFAPVIQIKMDGNKDNSTESQITRAVKAAMEQAFKDFRAIIDSGVAY
jgi:SLT domain-containing protein